MAFKITPEWLIDLPEEMEHRVEDDKLVFWKTGITIVIAVFSMPEGVSKLELLNQIQQKLPDLVLETLVSTKGEVVGLGYSQIQVINEDKKRLSLVTFTASDTSCVQTGFFLDDPANLDWAKAVWKGIVYIPDQQQAQELAASSDS